MDGGSESVKTKISDFNTPTLKTTSVLREARETYGRTRDGKYSSASPVFSGQGPDELGQVACFDPASNVTAFQKWIVG